MAHRARPSHARARAWCAWRRSPSSTSRAGASRRSPARCRRARARSTTVPGAPRNATSACRIRSRYRPDALLNPAVFHDAMPASVIKPIMAAAFLVRSGGRRALARRRAGGDARTRHPVARTACAAQLMRSTSARFLDRMFCADQGFARCGRPWRIQAMAQALRLERRLRDAARGLRQARSAVRTRGRRRRRRGTGRAVGDARSVRSPADRTRRRTARRTVLPAGRRSRSTAARGARPVPTAARARRLGEVQRRRRRRCRRRRLGPGSCAGERARRRRHDGVRSPPRPTARREVRKPHLVSAVRGVAGPTVRGRSSWR